jgi:hypothetical protein
LDLAVRMILRHACDRKDAAAAVCYLLELGVRVGRRIASAIGSRDAGAGLPSILITELHG